MSFPRQQARTRRFSLGVPRSFTFAPDGDRFLFLRTPSGADPATGLWIAERAADGSVDERCLVDPHTLDVDDVDLPAEERARRERLREQAGGVVAYATDREANLVAFAFGGRLFTHHLPTGQTIQHPSAGPVFDPRPSPDGQRIAYVSGDGLHVVELPGGPGQPGATRPVLIEDGIAWGRAEFVAAEEMRRLRGYWWGPDSLRLAAARVDESEVAVWHIADPANPWKPAAEHRYPAAGTTNADVRLAVVSLEDGRRIDVAWDRADAPYLTRVAWDEADGQDRLTIQVQTRDQRRVEILRVDTTSGRTTPLRVCTDDAWVELIEGSPAWCGDALVTVEDLPDHGEGGSRSLLVDGRPITSPGMQVRGVVLASDDQVVFTASEADPTAVAAYRYLGGGDPERLGATKDGVTVAAAGGGTTVLTTSSLEWPVAQVEVRWSPAVGGGSGQLVVHAEVPEVTVAPRWLTLGERKLRAALLLPSEDDGHASLPVLLDPYGGPHAQRVIKSTVAMASSQWLADQGFAVLVVDGRGSPGRGPVWEREVEGDLATVPLEDQLDALDAAAELEPRLDLERVAIRGWSFGGYLAAAAALRAPDRVRAAIAGAPVTDWQLYDTHYTERYLGVPERTPEAYAVSSLVGSNGELGPAEPWADGHTPELMVIHGLADDNVVAAHSLRLSGALLADGRPHRFLPLSGVTHMTPQEVVAEQLLVLQVRFLREALGVET